MNDPNKRIDVNLSSLLSLKAELLRKHEEVNKAKSTHLINNFVPKKRPAKLPTESKKSQPKNNTEQYEDTELINKSKKILEAKTKLYDRMSASGGTLNSDDNCLVMFNRKKKSGLNQEPLSSEESDDDQTYNVDYSGDDWVEYTDCLGRTRKCLKNDVEFFKKKDLELAETVAKRKEMNSDEPAKWILDTKGEVDPPVQQQLPNEDFDDSLSMISKMSKIDEMRLNWEKQEEDNINKDYVHYQGVLFDEARTHGVGYYGFSTDETERAKQQRELETLRAKTLESQKQREVQRQSREKIIAERVKAAKNRQRARMGLPPLEDEPEVEEKLLYDKSEEEKKKRQEEKLKKSKDAEERQLEEERKRHIRPWDKGKDGIKYNDRNAKDEEWTYKPEREPMSQEQWNDVKRSERNSEFAPAHIYDELKLKQNTHQFDDRGNNIEYENKTLNFTTKKKNKFIRRNTEANTSNDSQYDPIINELYDEDDNYSKPEEGRKRTEIPPPPTFDYYGPSTSKKQKLTKSNQNLETSIEAGLKFLRDQSDKDTLSTKMKWSSNAGY